jgi:hypothetical protein
VEANVSQERTEAVVLRGVDFSETSRIVTFLCPDRGRMACIAQGARRPGNALATRLDTFNRLDILYYWRDSRSVQKLGEVSVIDTFSGIKRDVEKTVYASFALELAGKTAQENEPSQGLYTELVRGLESLAQWTGDVRAHAAWQAVRLLAEAGYAPAAGGGAVGFSYDSGLTGPGERRDRGVSMSQAAALAALVAAREACPDTGEGAALFGLVSRFAERQLETDFRSVRVIGQMFPPAAGRS